MIPIATMINKKATREYRTTEHKSPQKHSWQNPTNHPTNNPNHQNIIPNLLHPVRQSTHPIHHHHHHHHQNLTTQNITPKCAQPSNTSSSPVQHTTNQTNVKEPP
ncbi:unnamed protein product [Tuber aestivum]|uniref:Uncharacterized protein n=1 Tax=Tuber aestivum TaxID=59557 RepID=A0A292PPM3_9PEZI|nr:unnamed protein product [Tuber aestivum]